ncbi:MAG: fructose PTS transporter subunit IIA [Parachlamydiaceae bacterium]|nr:fructose PTS transporter subunit IIA [Parachlamydiaceae bacterium]
MHISRYMDPKLVLFLNATTRDEVLSQMVQNLFNAGKLNHQEQFLQAILDREKIVSTGIGLGIAIPHAKLASYNEFFIVIGILDKPVQWNALDGAPVRMVFMIGGPDDKQTEYLQILSSLTQFLKNEEHRQQILSLKFPTDILELFHSI